MCCDALVISLIVLTRDGLDPVFQDCFIFVAIIIMVCCGEGGRERGKTRVSLKKKLFQRQGQYSLVFTRNRDGYICMFRFSFSSFLLCGLV